MNAEERILELLAEYLNKTDRILDRMEKTDKQSEKTEQSIQLLAKTVIEHDLKFLTVQNWIRQINEDAAETRMNIKRLSEDGNRLRQENGILITELLSLSKRVTNVEGKS